MGAVGAVWRRFAELETLNKLAENNEDLRKISELLKAEYQAINEEIDLTDQIRLIDEEEKRFIGVFPFKQALARSKQLGKDLLLANGKISPPLCKMTFYRDNMYRRFVAEFIMKDAANNRYAKKKEKPKIITLKPKMSISDLKNKTKQAVALAEKNDIIRVVLTMRREFREQGSNIFRSFCEEVEASLEMVKAPVELKGDAVKDAEKDTEEEGGEEAEEEALDPKETLVIKAEFRKRASEGQYLPSDAVSITQEKTRELINEYFERMMEAPRPKKMHAKLESTANREELAALAEDLKSSYPGEAQGKARGAGQDPVKAMMRDEARRLKRIQLLESQDTRPSVKGKSDVRKRILDGREHLIDKQEEIKKEDLKLPLMSDEVLALHQEAIANIERNAQKKVVLKGLLRKLNVI